MAWKFLVTNRSPSHKAAPVPARQRGFSLLELFVVAAVLGAVLSIILGRVLLYQELAEKTSVETTLIHLRTALLYKVAETRAHKTEREVAALIGANPVPWLTSPPAGYVGELDHPNWEDIPAGSWYFDQEKHALCYKPKRGGHLTAGRGGLLSLCYAVTGIVRTAEKETDIPIVEGINLSSREPYSWFSTDSQVVSP